MVIIDMTRVSFLSSKTIPSNISHDLGDLVRRAEEFLEKESDCHDKGKRKEALARIIHWTIAYHILPESYENADLVKNSRYSTSLTLKDSSMDWKPLRLSILSTSIPPRLRMINMFAEVTKKDIKAKNGVIHQISHPLLPPPSIFQEAFSLPEVFSLLTTAIQHAGLIGAIDRWKYSRDDGHDVGFMGATATTAFAPTSGAFKHLAKNLQLHLFSSFGQKALKKLLVYHIIPSFVLHTDYFHNSTSDVTQCDFSRYFDDALKTQFESVAVPTFLDDDVEDLVLSRDISPSPLLDLVYKHNNATLPTLLQDHYLQVHVVCYRSNLPFPGSRYFTSFKVNGHHLGPFDIPARNGALHVLSTILDPCKRHDHHGGDDEIVDEATWENWEEWLPQWAMEN